LMLPVLVEEKAGEARRQLKRQQEILYRSKGLLSSAA